MSDLFAIITKLIIIYIEHGRGSGQVFVSKSMWRKQVYIYAANHIVLCITYVLYIIGIILVCVFLVHLHV